jgi:basic membrane protein A
VSAPNLRASVPEKETTLRQVMKYAVAATAATLALAACGSSSSTPGATGSSTGGTGTAGGGIKVGMAYDVGGRGDQSFNDAAAAGLDKAVKELGVSGKEASATNGEAESAREERLRQLIDAGYTNIVAVGFAYAKSVGKVAKANPNVKFAIVDDASADSTGANIENITFAEHEGSFLVGAAAALKSKANHIGFVGGVETDLIKKFEAGYKAGAKAVNPNIVIDVKYLTQPPDFSGFGDVAKGKAAADGMYQGGADVVYHAAGGSGGGVFNAAKAAGKLAIGVDSDQAKTAAADVRDVILTSMLKKVDVGVYDFIKSIKDGTFKAGVKAFNLKAGGVDFSTTGGKVDDIKKQLDDFKAKIISGEITVPEK